MIFIWNGVEIEAIDLDKAIPGPRAKEIARHLEPGYLRGYLEGRRVAVGFQEIRSKGKVGKGYRQIRSLMTMTHYDVPTEAPWRYAMYLKEKMLEQATATTGEDAQLTAPPVETSEAPPELELPEPTPQPTAPEVGPIGDDAQLTTPEVEPSTDEDHRSTDENEPLELREEADLQNKGGGEKKRRRKKRRKNSGSGEQHNTPCQ